VALTTTFYNTSPYWTLTKTTTNTGEGLTQEISASAAAGTAWFATMALRPDSATTASIGLSSNGTDGTWGTNTYSVASILSGPGVLIQEGGGLWKVTGLVAGQDTVIQVARVLENAGTLTLAIFPDSDTSITSGASVFVTAVQVSNLDVGVRYVKTTTAVASMSPKLTWNGTLTA
jgi:hypothetical protein